MTIKPFKPVVSWELNLKAPLGSEAVKMGAERVPGERRLGAIMFTDVVGYSSVMSSDETRGLRLLGEHSSLLRSVFPKYDGRIVKTTGDGFLVEFASAVEAVECAVAAQKEMARMTEGRKQEERIQIRIGIHVGDIVHKDGDVLGDAVNVAARVQPLAEPGGISITRQVVDQVERKVSYKLVKTGTFDLKNINYPVEVYRVSVQPERSEPSEKAVLDPHRVAILPLTNISGDPNDGYFADGMTEELIATVSRIGELSVISRTSIMKYKGATTSIGEIGAELSAGAVLEGSVRRAGNRVRITVQLIDAQRDKHLWAQSYDRDLTDVFAIQGDIAQKIADALEVQLLSKEKQSLQRTHAVNPDAYSLYLKGRFYWNERTEDGVRKALGCFEDAVRIAPDFAMGYSGLADCYLILADYYWISPAEAAPKVREYAMRALGLDASLAEAHASFGLGMLNLFWDFAVAEMEFKRALELRPNYAPALHWYCALLISRRKADESLAMEMRAVEIDPHSRIISMGVGVSLLMQGRAREAIEQFQRVIDLNPDFGVVHIQKSLAHVCLFEYDEATSEAKKAVQLEAGVFVKAWLAWTYAVSGQRQAAESLLREALLETKGYTSPSLVGSIKMALGQEEEGYSWLRRAVEERDSTIFSFGFVPQERKCMADPRWVEIEAKLGLPPGGKFPDWRT